MPHAALCICGQHGNLHFLQRALEDGLFSIEDEDGLSRPNMTAVLMAAKQVRISTRIVRPCDAAIVDVTCMASSQLFI